MVCAEYVLHILYVTYCSCWVRESLCMNSCFNHPSGTGQKKGWPEDVHCGSAIILLVRRSLHGAHWFLARCFHDLMNWLFNVKQFRGTRFSISAARMSKAGWWAIVANTALFSELCWHDAGLGFHGEVCHLRAVRWHALQPQLWLLWASTGGDGEQTASYSSASACSVGRLAGVEGAFSLSFWSFEVCRSSRNLGSLSVLLLLCLWGKDVVNGDQWAEGFIQDHLQGGRIWTGISQSDDLPHHWYILLI